MSSSGELDDEELDELGDLPARPVRALVRDLGGVGGRFGSGVEGEEDVGAVPGTLGSRVALAAARCAFVGLARFLPYADRDTRSSGLAPVC